MVNRYKIRPLLHGGICFLLLLYIIISPVLKASAIESTTYTYTLSADTYRYIRTQDAYLPGGTYLSEIGLNSPEDLFYIDGVLYIADSGNKRIVRYQLSDGELSYFGEKELNKPTGVAVDEDGSIFVADYGAEEIVIFSPDGQVKQRIQRPTDVFYGTSPYKPIKIGIDSYDNILAISEGTNEGILQFNSFGAFNGFFGANKTNNLSFKEWFEKVFYTEEQKENKFRNPPNIVSIDIAPDNLIYSVTKNDRWDSLKKLNLAGVNILQNSGNLWDEDNYVDVAVSSDGDMFAVTDTGSIEEFDDTGVLLLLFGGRAASSDRNGLTSVVSAIEVDENYNIYILDKERALIQTYYPTDYADLMHNANINYNNGLYEKSLADWSEILRMNPSSYMAHNGYGKAMFQMGEFKTAAEHYKIIQSGDRYSDCFWELRSNWLRLNMKKILFYIFGLTAVLFIIWLLRRKYDLYKPIRNGWSRLCKSNRLMKDLFVDTLYMLRHPIDCIYDLKLGHRGSVPASGILFGLAFIVCMVSRSFTSFVFEGGFSYWQDPVMVIITIIVPIMLFVIGSYLISSINDGEGSFKNVFTAVGYAFTPYIIFTPVMTVLSHIMTNKEQFIYDFSNYLIIGYTLLLIFLSVKEVHCYTPKKTIGNIMLTMAFMIIVVLAFTIMYILWREVISFLLEFIEEVKYRVFP